MTSGLPSTMHGVVRLPLVVATVRDLPLLLGVRAALTGSTMVSFPSLMVAVIIAMDWMWFLVVSGIEGRTSAPEDSGADSRPPACAGGRGECVSLVFLQSHGLPLLWRDG